MDEVKSPKDVRAFWEKKANSVENPNPSSGRNRSHGFSTGVRHGEDPAAEAKRRTKEELSEVLRQRRHSSASPEPHITAWVASRESTRSVDGRIYHGSWKKIAVAAADVGAELTTSPTITRSISLRPSYNHKPANDSTKAKMAERISSFKRATSTKPHPPLKPTNSNKYKLLPPPPQRRPFSTSAIEGNTTVAYSQDMDSKHQSLQPIYQVYIIRCVYNYLSDV